MAASCHELSDEWMSELKAFDNTKTGVKGLVDSGISKVPRIFHTNSTTSNLQDSWETSDDLAVPVIDLEGTSDPRRRELVADEIKNACEEWGFFQVVNHGVPLTLLDDVLRAVKGFHEQDDDAKKPYYSRDTSREFKYYSGYPSFTGKVPNWKDTLTCVVAPHLDPTVLPEICRDAILEYTKQVKYLGTVLLELFSEALGLKPTHLNEMECGEGIYIMGHYYPACPEPELAIGTKSHADANFFTILLQDNTGGLQILHHNRWLHVHPVSGALLINVGDFLQLLTNGRFKSVIHRVLALRVGPRISIACFFRTHFQDPQQSRLYGPIKELLSEENPPIYKETTITEFLTNYYIKGPSASSSLSRFML